jgi:hypothetical protein
MEDVIKKIHPNMKKFVEKSLDLIDINEFYENYKQRGGILDGYHMHIYMIQWFLKLEIGFDRVAYPEFNHIQRVSNLPEKDIKECLSYLNYSLGNTKQTGGHDYVLIYDKIKEMIK